MVLPGDAGGWNRETIQRALQGDIDTVIGVFPDERRAERGLRALADAGFEKNDLTIVSKGSDAAEEIPSQVASEKGWKGTVGGAALGGGIGGVLAGLVGAGLIAIPGAGPFLAAGWLGAALAGAATGAFVGGLAGAFSQLGVPKSVAERYEDQLNQGEYLVMALAKRGERQATAEQVLNQSGAHDVASYRVQARPQEFPGATPAGGEQVHQEG